MNVMCTNKYVAIFSLSALCFCSFGALGQADRAIRYGAPFLTIAPDARAAGLGDQGVASAPDNNSQYWNAAKYLFADTRMGATYTYTPWLQNITDNVYLNSLTGFYKLDDKQAVSGSLRYLSLGDLTINDLSGNYVRSFKPNEFAFDFGYSRRLGEKISASVSFRYLYSNLTGNASVPNLSVDTKAVSSVGADIGVYSQHAVGNNEFGWGASICNIGPKISYSNSGSKWFQPTTLRLGLRYTIKVNENHQISFLGETAKLLVPSPDYNSNGVDLNADKSVIGGMFSSFGDSKGGFSGEMKEFVYSLGAEYCYQKSLAVRTGYFNESKEQGNRKFVTFGLGLNYKQMLIDLSYLVQTSGGSNSPLDNTLRASLGIRLNSFK